MPERSILLNKAGFQGRLAHQSPMDWCFIGTYLEEGPPPAMLSHQRQVRWGLISMCKGHSLGHRLRGDAVAGPCGLLPLPHTHRH